MIVEKQCAHYKRNCDKLAPCCKIFYPCRLCHDEQYGGPKGQGCKVETMDRFAVEIIRCRKCLAEQPQSNKCIQCEIEFAKYYCPICKLWESNQKKNIYHCEKCKMCRLGPKEKNFHCETCNVCFPISANHVCVENAFEQYCTVCFDYLKTSTKLVQQLMNCKHFIHVDCLNSLLKAGNNNCPVCNTAIYKMSKSEIQFYEQVNQDFHNAPDIPKEIKERKCNIICMECHLQTKDIPFSPYFQCSHCGSFNTKEVHMQLSSAFRYQQFIMNMIRPDYDRLIVRGNTKFQELNFNQVRLFQPKLNVIKLRGFQQIVDIIKQNDQKANTCSQCSPQLLPHVMSYPPRPEVPLRKPSEQKLLIKKSFTESTESASQERKKRESLLPKKQFAIKRATTSKNEDHSNEPTYEFGQLVAFSNALNVNPPERVTYKAFVTKGNNGMLVRQCLKSRSWWVLTEQPTEDMNFYWTQLRKQPYYSTLARYQTDQQPFSKTQSKQLLEKFKFKQELPNCNVFSSSSTLKVHNHLECNFQVCNKKALFYNMQNYYLNMAQDPFKFVPVTFHIQEGPKDPQFSRFEEYAKQNNVLMWIVKPGEQSNRGQGIEVANSISQVRKLVSTKEVHSNGVLKTFIVQQYINRPLLYNKRKFDIRCYMLVTSINNQMKAYWYQEGYIRTSCKEFSLEDTECKFTHLTNDAVQKKSNQYGKFETGNKVSFNEFTRYLSENYNVKFQGIVEQLKALTTDIVKATYKHLDPNRHFYSFELFGLDFMIDADMKPWLIEVNTNPCLETCCPLLARLISHLIENTIRIAIDPMFPAPQNKKKPLVDFKNYFDLIFSTTLEEKQELPPIQQDDDEEEVEDD